MTTKSVADLAVELIRAATAPDSAKRVKDLVDATKAYSAKVEEAKAHHDEAERKLDRAFEIERDAKQKVDGTVAERQRLAKLDDELAEKKRELAEREAGVSVKERELAQRETRLADNERKHAHAAEAWKKDADVLRSSLDARKAELDKREARAKDFARSLVG